MAILEAHHISKRYGPFTALHDVSLSIDAGEVVGFLGPNGAGKTTTMDICCGALSRSGGDLLVAGSDPATDPLASAGILGYLPQELPLYRDMTVTQYLDHIARLKHIAKAERRHAVSEVIEQCDLRPVAKRHINKLSGGNRQRTGLAQALLGKPKLLVLDEPTVGLDPAQIAIFRELIRSLASEHSILLSTHIMAEVEICCDRVVMINHGYNVLNEPIADFQARRRDHNQLRLRLQTPRAQELSHAVNDLDVQIINDHELLITGNTQPDTLASLAAQHGGLEELRVEQRSLEEVFKDIIANSGA